LELVKLPFDLAITLRHLALVTLIKLQSLAKGKEMFGPVVTLPGNGRFPLSISSSGYLSSPPDSKDRVPQQEWRG